MAADGQIEAREPRVYGSRGRGRPAKVFAITELGRDRFDQQYDDLALQALRFLEETGGDDAAPTFAPPRGAGLERPPNPGLAPGPRPQPPPGPGPAPTPGGHPPPGPEGPG